MSGISTEAAVFFYAGLSGMTVLSAYGILVCIRRIIPHSAAAVNIEDLIFCVGTSGYLFRQMYATTYGSVRWYFILGVVCGGLLEYFVIFSVKKLYVKSRKKLEKSKKNR